MIEMLDLAIQAAKNAGKAILSVYGQTNLELETKGDGSPLTIADQLAHQIIHDQLTSTAITIVSEEGDHLHMDADVYWLCDPLDGTKDFIAQNDEFTVNIALIKNQRPVLGVVYAPALELLYAGAKDLGASVTRKGIRSDCRQYAKQPTLRMAISNFHDHPDTDLFAKANNIEHRVAVGSALKYGRLAAGDIDVFPRLVGSSEWDIAAGQAVLEAAGGQVLDWHSQKPLQYGKTGRRNPRLISFRAPYTIDDFILINDYQAELL